LFHTDPYTEKAEAYVGVNLVKKIREELLISKSELARKAGVSPLTIDRVENGMDCRMDTKRKIISALGYAVSEKDKVFPRHSAHFLLRRSKK
jgi:predicted transcriptional regulator